MAHNKLREKKRTHTFDKKRKWKFQEKMVSWNKNGVSFACLVCVWPYLYRVNLTCQCDLNARMFVSENLYWIWLGTFESNRFFWHFWDVNLYWIENARFFSQSILANKVYRRHSIADCTSARGSNQSQAKQFTFGICDENVDIYVMFAVNWIVA